MVTEGRGDETSPAVKASSMIISKDSIQVVLISLSVEVRKQKLSARAS